MNNSKVFGTYPDGDTAVSVTLQSATLSAEIVTHGASLRKLVVMLSSGPRNVVLGLDNLETYIAHGSHVGATAGRFAGKIPNGQVVIDGTVHQLSQNAGGQHHVHGGQQGLGRRNWTLLETSKTSAKFQIVSADGDEGYPGELTVTCTYTLTDTDLQIVYEAASSKDTPLNLLHHGYFNLDGAGTIHGHKLRILANTVFERGTDGDVTGERVAPPAIRDFQKSQLIDKTTAFDTTYSMQDAPTQTPKLAASLFASQDDLQMDVLTTEPSLHFYDGGKLNVQNANDSGVNLTAHQGLCLEPTRGLQAISGKPIGYAILSAETIYRQETIYRFLDMGKRSKD